MREASGDNPSECEGVPFRRLPSSLLSRGHSPLAGCLSSLSPSTDACARPRSSCGRGTPHPSSRAVRHAPFAAVVIPLVRLLRESVFLAIVLALHLGVAAFAAWVFLAPRSAAPTPKLLADVLELTLAETESATPTEATASPPRPRAAAAAAPSPSVAPYLFDAASPMALPPPDEPWDDARRSRPPSVSPPVSARAAPENEEFLPVPHRAPFADLPEIALPPPKRVSDAPPRPDAGATARLEQPRLTTDLSRLPKHYPPEARRKRWEGTVVLRLEVAADGTLANPPEIHRSSGHDVLDRAALRMIRPARFEGGPGVLLQPIEYKLR